MLGLPYASSFHPLQQLAEGVFFGFEASLNLISSVKEYITQYIYIVKFKGRRSTYVEFDSDGFYWIEFVDNIIRRKGLCNDELKKKANKKGVFRSRFITKRQQRDNFDLRWSFLAKGLGKLQDRQRFSREELSQSLLKPFELKRGFVTSLQAIGEHQMSFINAILCAVGDARWKTRELPLVNFIVRRIRVNSRKE